MHKSMVLVNDSQYDYIVILRALADCFTVITLLLYRPVKAKF